MKIIYRPTLFRFSQEDWQVWQDTMTWLGNPMGPQASPVYMCGSGTIPAGLAVVSATAVVPSADSQCRCDPIATPLASVIGHTDHHQPDAGYGTEEFIDLDMLINYVADQHNGTTNPSMPLDVVNYVTDKPYYSR